MHLKNMKEFVLCTLKVLDVCVCEVDFIMQKCNFLGSRYSRETHTGKFLYKVKWVLIFEFNGKPPEC